MKKFWLHSDRLGSIQAITDQGGGEIERRSYSPYGQKIADTPTYTDSRSWIDQRTDETGLTYLHARYYDPQLGLFISPDPIGPAGGLNSYAYGFGDPVNLTDRFGLGPCGEHGSWSNSGGQSGTWDYGPCPDSGLPFNRTNGPSITQNIQKFFEWLRRNGMCHPGMPCYNGPTTDQPGPGSGQIPVLTCPGDPGCPESTQPVCEGHKCKAHEPWANKETIPLGNDAEFVRDAETGQVLSITYKNGPEPITFGTGNFDLVWMSPNTVVTAALSPAGGLDISTDIPVRVGPSGRVTFLSISSDGYYRSSDFRLQGRLPQGLNRMYGDPMGVLFRVAVTVESYRLQMIYDYMALLQKLHPPRR